MTQQKKIKKTLEKQSEYQQMVAANLDLDDPDHQGNIKLELTNRL